MIVIITGATHSGKTSYILYFPGPYQDGIDKKWLFKGVFGFT